MSNMLKVSERNLSSICTKTQLSLISPPGSNLIGDSEHFNVTVTVLVLATVTVGLILFSRGIIRIVISSDLGVIDNEEHETTAVIDGEDDGCCRITPICPPPPLPSATSVEVDGDSDVNGIMRSLFQSPSQ